MVSECAQKKHQAHSLRTFILAPLISYSVGVYVGAGSRHEDLETSGSAYLLDKMLLRGTNNRSKSQINMDIETIGAEY